jgi:transcriptional regulator with XRE-family HTH domain
MADIKAFRKENNLTQEQVAEYLGCKKAFICQIG